MLWMTRAGTMPGQGDIVLVPVPFTDLSSTRRRPVIVISNGSYHHSTEGMVVAAMRPPLGLLMIPVAYLLSFVAVVVGAEVFFVWLVRKVRSTSRGSI
jgi:mRNA interferase MazF